MTMGRFPLLAVAILTGATPAFAADDPVVQREQQKKVLAEVEQTARRVTTTLRVLSYQKLDPTTEQKLLDEVATTLRKLSQDEIKAVMTHLEAAVKAPDEATSTAEQREAYQKHRQVVTSLRSMLVKLDVLKSLDQAADRLGRFGKDQHDLHLRALSADNRVRNARRPIEVREEQSDAQGDLKAETTNLIKQLTSLRSGLNPEQKERLDKADAFGRLGQLVAQMEIAAQTLNAANYRPASEIQLKNANELQSLAAALRAPRDKMTALREARDQIEKLRLTQENLKKETETKPDLTPQSRRIDRSRTDPLREHTNQLADKQARLEFDTRDAKKMLEDAAKEVAAKITPAESEMRRAQDELRQQDLVDAPEPQQNAADRLKDARDELDKLIAKAEKERSDPLTAAKKAAEMIAQLIKEQKAAKELTAQNAKKPENLKPATDAQKDVAKKTEEVKNLPLPENQPAKDALDRAAEATKKAADALAKKDATEAQPKQTDALKALEDAKKALEEQVATIEKRREDIAKLEDAAKKLEELTKEEKKVAADALAKANDAKPDQKPNTSELAKKQEQLTPPTKDVGEQVKDLAPKAAEKIAEATKNQDMAKNELQKNQPMPGAQQATEAAKNLEKAKDELQAKADELKAKEIADQQALQPNKVDPQAAAQQLAKAIEQAEKAAQEANKAAEQLGQKPMQGEPMDPMQAAAQQLAKLQQQVAEQAQKLNKQDASQSANEAAKALEKGDLQQALEQQQKALDQLNKDGSQPMQGDKPMQGQPKQGEKPMQGGQPQPSQAQNPGQLAQSQQQIKDATQALAKSAEANAAAQAALAQAQAQAPMAVQPQLNNAQQQLNQAQQQLNQGQPAQAGQNQQQAAQQLGQALNALNAAAQAQGQQPSQPGQNQQANAQPGQQPGQPGQQPGQPGKQPGQPQNGQPGQPGQQGKQPGQPQEKNEGIAEGNRQGPAQLKDGKASGKTVEGDGSFINLQKRERDKVQQQAEAAFPAEFRELIKQYNINIKNNGKPQAPATPPAKK